jgi:hypothetical protein
MLLSLASLTAFGFLYIILPMKLPLTTRFVDRGTGKGVLGFIRLATDRDLLLWTGWRYRPTDEDRAWDWWGIYQECRALTGRYECYAALALDELQGMAVLDLKLKNITVGRAITVDYLATNPANRKPKQGLKHVGVALMAAAIVRSLECDASGGIWLESLPGATGFYESLGMAREPHRSDEGNLIYVLQSGTSKQLLDEIKEQGIVEP